MTTTNTIKTIPTKYKNIEFRSRLEARWAIYFDIIRLKWIYEPEGYILPSGVWYLPDFLIPGFGFVEIKFKASDEEIEKCKELSKLNGGTDVALFEGVPERTAYRYFNNGKEGPCLYFDRYTILKWKQIPYFCGSLDNVSELDIKNDAHDSRTNIAICMANDEKFKHGVHLDYSKGVLPLRFF